MKTFLLLISGMLSMTAIAQDTTKVEQYCELQVQNRLFSNRVTIDVNFGEERKFWAGDTRLRDEVSGRLKKFNSLTDALNYMGAQGWSLVNAFPTTTTSGPVIYYFYFRKLFNKVDVMRGEKD